MASFDFWLIGSAQPQRLDVSAKNIDELAEMMGRARFVAADLQADDFGEVRRILVAANRVQAVAEVS